MMWLKIMLLEKKPSGLLTTTHQGHAGKKPGIGTMA